VHNGIEYGDMQLIGEAYEVLTAVGGCSNAQCATTMAKWNQGALGSVRGRRARSRPPFALLLKQGHSFLSPLLKSLLLHLFSFFYVQFIYFFSIRLFLLLPFFKKKNRCLVFGRNFGPHFGHPRRWRRACTWAQRQRR